MTTPARSERNAPRTKPLAQATQLTSSAPVQITLLLLYSLPLLMLLMSAFASSGFKYESDMLAITLRVVTQYVETLREAFATFVIPFVTALSAGRWSESTKGGLKPLQLFFVLVSLLVVAIVLLAYMSVHAADITASLDLSSDEASGQVEQAIGITSSYVKELLTYISLFLGVSLWKKE